MSRRTPLYVFVLLVVLLAGCGSPSRAASGGSGKDGAISSSGTASSRGTATPERGTAQGVADVAYAGSLQFLNERVVGPAFTKATGVAYRGRGAGAIGLAKEIQSGEINPNVFESIGTEPIKSLEPRFTRWYVQDAASPIVLAYNPKGPFASRLAAIAKGTKPLSDLFSLLAKPGFHLGRTNPNTDPQGQAFYEMVELAISTYHLPSDTLTKVLGSVSNPSQIFAETALEARLEAGQLDAASAFRSQAVQLHLPYVPLPASIDFGDPSLASHYAKATLKLANGKVVHGSPLVVDVTAIGTHDSSAADAYLAYVLSPAGRSAFAANGFTLLPLRALGDAGAIPKVVRHDLSSP